MALLGELCKLLTNIVLRMVLLYLRIDFLFSSDQKNPSVSLKEIFEMRKEIFGHLKSPGR